MDASSEKDGSESGCAICTALISLILKKSVILKYIDFFLNSNKWRTFIKWRCFKSSRNKIKINCCICNKY